jgi:hypothetical protein
MRSTNCTSSFPDDYQTLFRLYTKLLAHSFRAQVVLLFFPFEGVIVQGSTFYTGRGGLGSAGVYLRLNW